MTDIDPIDTNKRALERATADHLTIRLEGGQLTASGHETLVEAFCDKPDGSWYQVWATAGSYLDGHDEYLVTFSCQCPAGDTATHGITRCKHEAALATRLAGAGLILVDPHGRYRTTSTAGKPNDQLGHLLNLPSLLLCAEERA
jgi:hypothetical protein